MNRYRENRVRRDASGITLVELVVTMAISAVVVPIVFGVLVGAQRQAATTVETADAIDGVRLAVGTMGRQIRLGSGPMAFSNGPSSSAPAPGFGFATKYDVDGSPRTAAQCVQFRIKAGVLQTRTFTVQPSAEQGWTAVTVVGGEVTSTAPFSRIADAPAAVRIQFSAKQRTGRSVAVDNILTARNTTSAAIACGTFS